LRRRHRPVERAAEVERIGVERFGISVPGAGGERACDEDGDGEQVQCPHDDRYSEQTTRQRTSGATWRISAALARGKTGT
jgi:hypothetical protein